MSEDDAGGDVADTNGISLTNQNHSRKSSASERTSSEPSLHQNGCLEVTNSSVSPNMTVGGSQSTDLEGGHDIAGNDTCQCFMKKSSSSCRHCENICTSCRLRQSRNTSKSSPCSTTCRVFSNNAGGDSSKGSSVVQKPQSQPVRPSSLHLVHRHTAGSSLAQNCQRQTNISYNAQRRNIPAKLEAAQHITSRQNKICPSFTKDQKVGPRHRDKRFENHSSAAKIPHCFPEDKSKMTLSCCQNPRTTRRPDDGSQDAESTLHSKPASIKEHFRHKQQAAAVLTVYRNDDQTQSQAEMKQEPSVFNKLKTLIMGKSKSTDNHSDSEAKTSQDQLLSSVWRDYYKKCVKHVEEDLQSFKSFCSLTSAEQQQDVLFREFVVREFPGSSQLKGSLGSADDPEPSVGRKFHKKGKNGCIIDKSSTVFTNGSRCLDDNGNPHGSSQNGLVSMGRQPQKLVMNGTREASGDTSFNIGEHRKGVSSAVEKPITHCSGGTVESSLDEVFEDFTTSMSACLTNLSRKESGESLGKSPPIAQRYYHVFREGELEELITAHVPVLNIVNSYFDHANWCLIAEKVSSH